MRISTVITWWARSRGRPRHCRETRERLMPTASSTSLSPHVWFRTLVFKLRSPSLTTGMHFGPNDGTCEAATACKDEDQSCVEIHSSSFSWRSGESRCLRYPGNAQTTEEGGPRRDGGCFAKIRRKQPNGAAALDARTADAGGMNRGRLSNVPVSSPGSWAEPRRDVAMPLATSLAAGRSNW